MYKIFYKDEEFATVSDEEAKKIGEYLLDKNNGQHIPINGEVLKKNAITIRKIGQDEKVCDDRMVLHNGELMNWRKYMDIWNEEQETMKKETPEEKAFRNYKCKFTWYYLLQTGYSNFFGSEDWKRMSPYDTFKWFDKLIWEQQPKMMSKFTEKMEGFFTENPDEVWIDRKMFLKFLPKTTFKPIVQSF